LVVEDVDATVRRQVWNPRGEPLGFIGAMDARRPTVLLDLLGYHDTPPCHITGYALAIPILSFPTKVAPDVSPSKAD